MTVSTKVVVVAVPTFHRAALLESLLPVLEDQRAQLHSKGVTCRILIVDNDPDASAAHVASAAGVDYVVEPTRGLAAVRNRAITESADAHALVFIDDDEIPETDWLVRLHRRWRETGAAAVSGRVESRLPEDVDPWIVAGGFFTRVRFGDGAEQPFAPTNNLLLDLDFVRGHALWFDEKFGLSGGEDIHFTTRLVAAGGRIIAAPDALVWDPVSPERLTRSWVLRRAYRVGISTTRSAVSVRDSMVRRWTARLKALVGGAGRVLLGGANWLLGTLTRSTRRTARGARAIARGAGLLMGAFGADYAEYARRTS